MSRRLVRTALVLAHLAVCGLGFCAGGLPAQTATDGGEQIATTAQDTTSPERPAPAQPNVPATGDAPPRVAGPTPAVEEVRPELYYLKTKDGKLEPVLGFTYEDFYRLYRLEQNLQKGAKPPAFRFDKATFAGKVENGRLALRAEFRIVALNAGWTRIPLGMSSALLAEPPKPNGGALETGETERVLQFDATEGYVLWLEGEKDAVHTVVLEQLLVPLEMNGEESRVRLALPRSLTMADVRIQVPVANARVKVSDAAAVVSTKAVGDDATEAAFAARGGEVQVSWRGGTSEAAAPMRVVEATSAIRATVDDRAILWEAQLAVRPVGEPLDSFDVRLPAAAQLDPVAPGGYVVSVSGEAERVATVSLKKPTTEALAIRLVCRRPRNVAEAKETVDFAGFEVVGAARQSGNIVVAIDGDWRIAWQRRAEVRDAEQPPESLTPPEDQQAYPFAYYRQPFSLVGEIAAQPARLDIEPQYQVTVEGDRLLLNARLMYKVRGAKVAKVQLRLNGWALDELGPPGLIHSAGAVAGEDGLLTIPLAQRMRSTFDVTFTARRPLAVDVRRVEFALPGVTADVIAPPTLVVETADNIDLMPVAAETSHLTPRGNGPPATMTNGKRRHPPLVYRVLGDGSEARFVADRTLRKGEVSAESTADVSLAGGEVRVEQHLDLRVAFEALNRIVLELPAELAARRDVSYLIDGQPALPIAMNELAVGANAAAAANAASGKSGGAADMAWIAIEPPAAIEDRARLTIRHASALARGGESAVPRSLSVPLALPADAALRSSVVRVTSPSPGTIGAESPWAISEGSSSGAAEFRANGRAARITLKMTAEPKRTVVQTTWIRTVVADGMRQDRAAFRVETDEPALDVGLPAGATANQIAIWVDQRQVVPRIAPRAEDSPTGTLSVRVDLPDARGARSAATTRPRVHTIEVLYNVTATGDPFGSHRWEPPRIVGEAWEMRTLWEVVLPRNEHLVADPDGFTPEYAWQWDTGLRWGDAEIFPVLSRRPTLSTAELQRITAASPVRITSGQTNRYLFSVSGPAGSMEVRTAPRSLLVLVASGIAIVFVLMLIYAPAARRPTVMLAVGVALVGIAFWSPSAAILGAQAAAVGLALSIAAGAMSWWLGDRRQPASSPSAPALRVDRGSSANRPRREDRSQATTLTVPAEVSAGEAKP